MDLFKYIYVGACYYALLSVIQESLQAPKQISDKIFKTVNVDDSYGVKGV